jgi:transcriptional regulator with XRE-family HTH domain
MSVKDFSKKLKEARIEKGLSQRSLGLSIGLSDKTISSYESSRSYPSLDILKKLTEELGKSFDYFLSSEGERDILLERIKDLERENSVLRDMINKEE